MIASTHCFCMGVLAGCFCLEPNLAVHTWKRVWTAMDVLLQCQALLVSACFPRSLVLSVVGGWLAVSGFTLAKGLPVSE